MGSDTRDSKHARLSHSHSLSLFPFRDSLLLLVCPSFQAVTAVHARTQCDHEKKREGVRKESPVRTSLCQRNFHSKSIASNAAWHSLSAYLKRITDVRGKDGNERRRAKGRLVSVREREREKEREKESRKGKGEAIGERDAGRDVGHTRHEGHNQRLMPCLQTGNMLSASPHRRSLVFFSCSASPRTLLLVLLQELQRSRHLSQELRISLHGRRVAHQDRPLVIGHHAGWWRLLRLTTGQGG